MTDEQKQKYREAQKHKYHNMTDEQEQKYIEAQKHRYHNMTNEQQQKQKVTTFFKQRVSIIL